MGGRHRGEMRGDVDARPLGHRRRSDDRLLVVSGLRQKALDDLRQFLATVFEDVMSRIAPGMDFRLRKSALPFVAEGGVEDEVALAPAE